MADALDLLLGFDDDAKLLKTQSPVQRPDPIIRPGEEPRRQQRPVPQMAPPSGGRQQPNSADIRAPAPSAPAGDAAAEWIGLMQKHRVPSHQWSDHSDHYYRLRDDPKADLGSIPPELAADMRMYRWKHPGLGGRAPEQNPTLPASQMPQPGTPPEAGRVPQFAQPGLQSPQQQESGTSLPSAPAPSGKSDALDDLLGFRPASKSVDSKSLTYDYGKTAGFVSQAKGSFAPTEGKWKQIIGRELYPNEPMAQAAARIRQTSDGRWYHTGDDGKKYEVHPPEGLGRLQNVGSAVGGALPAVAGGAAGLAALPFTGGAGSIPAAGMGAFAGESVRQLIGNKLAPETPGEYDLGHALIEGASGALGQGLGVGINRMLTRHNPVDIGHYDQGATKALYEKAEGMGVRLTPAEATNMNSLIGDQKRLQASPRAANDMMKFAEERNGEVNTAWQKFLLSIASPKDASAVGKRAVDAAEGVVERAQAQRTAAVDPFYKAAEKQIGTINPGQIVQFVEQALPHAKGSDRAALQFVQKQLSLTDGTGIDTSFRGLNGAKVAIDGVLQDEALATKNGIDRYAHATLQKIRNMLVDTIDNAPGAGGAAGPYASGRSTYAAMSDANVTPAQELLAPLLRANNSNSTIIKVAKAALDPTTRDPDIVRRARVLIEQQNPDVWQGMLRQYLQEHAMPALQENAKGAVSNAGGNIAKRVGNDAVENNLRAAMTPSQFSRYQDVMEVFRATGRALDTNSDTAFKQEAIKQAKNASGGAIARITRNANPMKLLENTADWFANANYERQAAALAKIVTQGDANAIHMLRQLRQVGPSDQRRNIIIGHLLEQAGEFGADKAYDKVMGR